MRAVIQALQALRGIATVSAATIVAEVGQLSRFEKPRQLMGYAGLVPSEYTHRRTTATGGDPYELWFSGSPVSATAATGNDVSTDRGFSGQVVAVTLREDHG